MTATAAPAAAAASAPSAAAASAPAASAPTQQRRRVRSTHASAVPTAPANTAALPPIAPRRRKFGMQAKAIGASLAVGALLTATILPSLSEADASPRSVSAAVEGQSFTAGDDLVADVSMREGYSATSPGEIAEARADAISAAVASGLPLEKVVDLPEATQVLMPMADGSYDFTDGFGASRPGRSHLGQDFAASIGTPIVAAMDGCVSRSSESYAGYGVTIQVESKRDGKTVSTVYSHMKNGTRAVQVGECVTAGQYLGDVGSTGFIVGSCLHFEVHINGSPIDPLGWLRENV